jgi:hypothetical protein
MVQGAGLYTQIRTVTGLKWDSPLTEIKPFEYTAYHTFVWGKVNEILRTEAE